MYSPHNFYVKFILLHVLRKIQYILLHIISSIVLNESLHSLSFSLFSKCMNAIPTNCVRFYLFLRIMFFT